MKWRNISVEAVEEIIRNPKLEKSSVRGRINLWGHFGDLSLKVTV